MNKVYGTMCMMGNRYPKSLECVTSLKGQVEKLFLCLNDFDSIPEALKEDWIEVVYVGKNIGAVGRYTMLPDFDGHLISCDDDLVYPKGYVSDFIDRYKSDGPAMLSHHGKKIINNKSVNYIHYLKESGYSDELDIPGAGVLFVPREFKGWNKMVLSEPKNPTDIYVGCIAKKMNIRVLSMPHKAGYFGHVEPPKGETIYDKETKYQNLASLFKEILNKI